MAGVLGAIIALVGTVLPPLIIISIISLFYIAFRDNKIVNGAMNGMQAGVAAIIVDVVFNMVNDVRKKDKVSIGIMIAVFIATFYVNIMIIILVCGIFGLLYNMYRRKRGKIQ